MRTAFIVYVLFLYYGVENSVLSQSSTCTTPDNYTVRFIVINMPHRKYRLDAIVQQINMLELKSIVDIIVPKSRQEITDMNGVESYQLWKMDPQDVYNTLKGNKKALHQTTSYWTRDVTMGEISLTLAHVDAAIESLSSCPSFTIILEDDAVFIQDFVRVFQAMVVELPEAYDMIFLGDEVIGDSNREKVTRFLTRREYAYQVSVNLTKLYLVTSTIDNVCAYPLDRRMPI